jgi:hypothetical protein
MAKPNWDRTWTIEAATDTVAALVVNPDGRAEIKLTAHRGNHHKVVYYAVERTNAPKSWQDVTLFPRGSKDIPDIFKFNPPPDPGPLAHATAAPYLTQTENMQADVEQDLNNLRLEGDLNVVDTTGNSATVTLYLVQRADDPTDWYVVLYVHGASANPDGAGVGHH